MPRSIATISPSATLSMPFGRAAMSMSFSLAVIIRKVETSGASRASMAALSCSVNCSRKAMCISGKFFSIAETRENSSIREMASQLPAAPPPRCCDGKKFPIWSGHDYS